MSHFTKHKNITLCILFVKGTDFIFQSFRVGVVPEWLDEIRWSDSISLVDGDHPQTPVSSNSLQQYGRLNCVVIVPSPSGRKLCSLLLMSCIAKGIRIVTLQESIRIVCTALSRPLFVQPVIVNDVTTKVINYFRFFHNLFPWHCPHRKN